MAAATASQAWAILTRHARDEIGPLRLQELCNDNDRVSSLVAVHNTTVSASSSPRFTMGMGSGGHASNAAPSRNVRRGGGGGGGGGRPTSPSDDDDDVENRILLADLSRQRMTLDTLNHLLRLASARNVRGFIRTLAWGQNDRDDPVVPRRTLLRGRQQQQHPHPQRGVGGGGGVHGWADPSSSIKKTRFEAGTVDGEATGGGAAGGGGGWNERTSPSMHLALRAPAGRGLEMLTSDGTNALDGIHGEWRRIERFSESLRRGQLRGATGSAMRDVVVVGSGVPVAALRFLYGALLRDGAGASGAAWGRSGSSGGRGSSDSSSGGGSAPPRRRMRFVTSVDPIAAASAVAGLDPGSTVVISVALRGDEETATATRTMKSWLLQGLGSNKRPELVVNKHMMLVTGNEKLKAAKPESVFLVPEHSRCEAFTTFTAAGLLPLSIVFGWKVVDKVLAGAHDLDVHFVETNPRHNLPVLLALADLWNGAFLQSSGGRVVTPFSEAFSAFPSFVAALEAQTCGNSGGKIAERNGRGPTAGISRGSAASAVVTDGGLNGDYDRALYQGGCVVSSELVMSMDTQAASNTAQMMGPDGLEEVFANQDALICSFFAHADVLAFGSGGGTGESSLGGGGSSGGLGGVSYLPSSNAAGGGTAEGNRPSTLLICGQCDPFTCGQLVALSEHRATVTARLWDVDPFARNVGSSLRAEQTEKLKERLHRMYEKIATNGSSTDSTDDSSEVNLATSTILGHYANLMRDKKMYVVKSP